MIKAYLDNNVYVDIEMGNLQEDRFQRRDLRISIDVIQKNMVFLC